MLMLVAQLCLIICNPMDCSPPGSSVHGILQAGILEWVAISFSRGSSRPRDSACISCTGRWIPHHLSHQGSPVCAKGAIYMGNVVDESGIEYVCVLVSPGLLKLAKLPPTGQKKQHFILPQLWRPEIPNQGVSRASSEGCGEASSFASSSLWGLSVFLGLQQHPVPVSISRWPSPLRLPLLFCLL